MCEVEIEHSSLDPIPCSPILFIGMVPYGAVMEGEEVVVLNEPEGVETENVNGVPKKAWKKWSLVQRAVFNNMYLAMDNQMCLRHPKSPMVPDEQWKTIRWNAAWLAADSLSVKGMDDLLAR